MSTRSMIGVEVEYGLVLAIYCHMDGSTHLTTLQTHYPTRDKVDALIALGDLSILEADIETCVAYGRDWGEEKTEADRLNLYQFNRRHHYSYLYTTNNQWVQFTQRREIHERTAARCI